MKTKHIIALIFVLGIIFILPTLLFLFSNYSFSKLDNFIFSQHVNKKLEYIFPNNDFLKIKRGDFYYRMFDFDKALESYFKVDQKKFPYNDILFHNIWNTLYNLWYQEKNFENKVNYWQQALSYYLKSLDEVEDIQTRKNYEFVLEKLNELMQKNKERKEVVDDEIKRRWEELEKKVNDIFNNL